MITPEQQQAIEYITKEFESSNVISIQGHISKIEAALSEHKNKLKTKHNHFNKQAAIAETILDNIIDKTKDLFEKYGVTPSRSYSGMGYSRSIYLNMKYLDNSGRYAENRSAALSIKAKYDQGDEDDLPYLNGFKTRYPTYKEFNTPTTETIIDAITDWIIFYKKKEIKKL